MASVDVINEVTKETRIFRINVAMINLHVYLILAITCTIELIVRMQAPL